jgi:hypothetical protein
MGREEEKESVCVREKEREREKEIEGRGYIEEKETSGEEWGKEREGDTVTHKWKVILNDGERGVHASEIGWRGI